MAKTLLAYVQDCLESMVSDSVSTITGASSTEEAIVIANIAKQTYEFMHAQFDWPYQKTITTLEGISDPTRPTYLRIPDDVQEVLWFKYNNKNVKYKSPEEFLDISISRKAAFDNADATVTSTTTLTGITFYVKNNGPATYYTSFDNEHLVFDAYESALDTTMQQSKTMAYVVMADDFTLSDAFVPVLPKSMEPMFQAEINAAAHLLLRQQASPVDEKRSLQARSKQKTKSDRVNRVVRKGYGRK